MAYTLSQGVDTQGLDSVQRGLLVGLPALVLILTIGTLLHRNPNNSASGNAKVIPIVSTLQSASGNSSANGSSASSSGIAADTSAPAAGSASLGFGSSVSGGSPSSTGGSSSSGGVVGGRGGGPLGGSGGVLPINQTVSVPPLNVQAGGKSVVNTSGTTVTVN
jgi:hypothetical protein